MKTKKTNRFIIAPYQIAMIVHIVENIGNNIDGRVGLTANCTIIVDLDESCAITTVVHEAVHVVQRVAEYIEGEIDGETEAYLTAWIFDKLLTCITTNENKK